jgi:HEPN domain-containing protein
MSDKPVTESASDLFKKATQNVKNIKNSLYEEDFDEEDRASGGYNSQQMAEKLLKGYLKENNIIPDQGHDLKKYYNKAININKNFEIIEDEILHLNDYQADIKYSTEIDVDKDLFRKILEDVKTIYNFPEFQKIYDKFVDNKLCKKIKEEDFDKMIKEYDNIINRDIIKQIECISYKHFENHEETRLSVENGYLADYHKIKGLLPHGAIAGEGRKLTYQLDDGNKKYYLERVYKMAKNDIYKSDLWEINGNVSDLNALVFVEQFEKHQGKK